MNYWVLYTYAVFNCFNFEPRWKLGKSVEIIYQSFKIISNEMSSTSLHGWTDLVVAVKKNNIDN